MTPRRPRTLVTGLFLTAALCLTTGASAAHEGDGGFDFDTGYGQPVQGIGYQGPYGQAPWDQGQYNQGFMPGHNRGSPFRKIARLALTAGGTVVAGLFGRQFGPIGMVVGGGLGFLVSNWLGKKLFGNGWEGAGYPGGFPKWSQGNYGTPIYDQGYDKGGPVYKSDVYTGSGDIGALRDAFYRTAQDFTRALKNGNQAEKEAAQRAYDAAREAYYRARGGN